MPKSSESRLEVILMPREKYPSDRVRLSNLFSQKISSKCNLNWIVQPYEKNSNLKVIKKGNNTFYLISSAGSGSFLINLFNRFLTLQKIAVISKLVKKKRVNVIQSGDGILEGFTSLFYSNKYKIVNSYYLSSIFHLFAKDQWKFNPTFWSYFNFFVSRVMEYRYSFLIGKSDFFQPISKKMLEHFSDIEIENSLPISTCHNEMLITKPISKNMDSKLRIVYIGQISMRRNLQFSLKIANELLRTYKMNNFKLKIVGDFQDNQSKVNLRSMLNNLALENHVEFVKYVDQNNIHKLFDDFSIGLSIYPVTEACNAGSPIKCLDYLSLGVPVLGNREVVDQNFVIKQSKGGLSLPYSPKLFANAIYKLSDKSNIIKKMGMSGKNWVIKNRSYDKTSNLIVNRYKELVKSSVK